MSLRDKDRDEFQKDLRSYLSKHFSVKNLQKYLDHIRKQPFYLSPCTQNEMPTNREIASNGGPDHVIRLCYAYCENAKLLPEQERMFEGDRQDEEKGKKLAGGARKQGSGFLSQVELAHSICEKNYIIAPPDPDQPSRISDDEIACLKALIQKTANWFEYQYTFGARQNNKKTKGRPGRPHIRKLEQNLAGLLYHAGITKKSIIAHYIALFLVDADLETSKKTSPISVRLSGMELNKLQ